MTHTVEDLMAAAVGQRPMDFETAFHQLMLGKAHATIEDRKIELAKNMFAKAVKEDIEEIEEKINSSDTESGGKKKKPKREEEDECYKIKEDASGGIRPKGTFGKPAQSTDKAAAKAEFAAMRKAKTPIYSKMKD